MAKLVDQPPADWLLRGASQIGQTPYVASPVPPPTGNPGDLAFLSMPYGYRLVNPSQFPVTPGLGGLPTVGGSLIGGAIGNSIGGFGRDTNGQLAGGLGSGVGAAIGQIAIQIPGVGAPLGAALGNVVGRGLSSVFFFAAGKQLRLAAGDTRSIERLKPGDATAVGIVRAVQVHLGTGQAVYRYGDVLVTGGHAVLEDGHWVRVRDSRKGQLLAGIVLPSVYNLVTSEHRILVADHCFADAAETDADLADLDSSLLALNAA